MILCNWTRRVKTRHTTKKPNTLSYEEFEYSKHQNVGLMQWMVDIYEPKSQKRRHFPLRLLEVPCLDNDHQFVRLCTFTNLSMDRVPHLQSRRSDRGIRGDDQWHRKKIRVQILLNRENRENKDQFTRKRTHEITWSKGKVITVTRKGSVDWPCSGRIEPEIIDLNERQERIQTRNNLGRKGFNRVRSWRGYQGQLSEIGKSSGRGVQELYGSD